MTRLILWAELVVGTALVCLSVFRVHVSVAPLVAGLIAIVISSAGLLGDDLLEDHPEEAEDELASRRR